MPQPRKVIKETLFYQRDLLNPKEWLNFVELDGFAPAWKRLRLGDEGLRVLQITICGWPDGPPVIAGTGGLRKLRFAPASWGTGKSGAARVYYVYFVEYGLVALIYAHAKNEMESISKAQKQQIKGLIEEIDEYLRQRGSHRRGKS